jgi:hypothetical protein
MDSTITRRKRRRPRELTYAETQGEHPFDWNAFLERAIRCGIDQHEAARVEALARGWVTCACGSQCSELERKSDGTPFDFNLRTNGQTFYHQIRNQSWSLAKITLNSIELRSAELLAEMEAAK